MYKTCYFLLLLLACGAQCFCSDGEPCGINEIRECVKQCPPDLSCKTKDALFKCRFDENEVCQWKCRCKKGYYRNAIGECISSEQCNQCRIFKHEFWSCGGFCDNSCFTLDTENRTHCMTQNIVCNKKCYCEDGYARDENGACIPVAQCNDKCTGPHEYFRKCKQTCPPDECAIIKTTYICDKQPPCEPGCNCQNNFLRQEPGGPCMPTSECK